MHILTSNAHEYMLLRTQGQKRNTLSNIGWVQLNCHVIKSTANSDIL